MSGEGDGARQRKRDDIEDIKEEQPDGAPLEHVQRPRTSIPGRRQQIEEDPPGAVGGQGTSYTSQYTEQERRVGGQARQLLEIFIMDRAQKDRLSADTSRTIQENVCHQQKQTTTRHNEDYLDDVSNALRAIGDQMSEDYELNRLIDKVPLQSPREIFFKVCMQMFQDGQFNWGRVVALFYFAYKLIVKAIVESTKCTPWVQEIFSWVLDFFYRYVAMWIVQRGGWRMIREYWGTSPRALSGLVATALLTVLYVWWKN